MRRRRSMRTEGSWPRAIQPLTVQGETPACCAASGMVSSSACVVASRGTPSLLAHRRWTHSGCQPTARVRRRSAPATRAAVDPREPVGLRSAPDADRSSVDFHDEWERLTTPPVTGDCG